MNVDESDFDMAMRRVQDAVDAFARAALAFNPIGVAIADLEAIMRAYAQQVIEAMAIGRTYQRLQWQSKQKAHRRRWKGLQR